MSAFHVGCIYNQVHFIEDFITEAKTMNPDKGAD